MAKYVLIFLLCIQYSYAQHPTEYKNQIKFSPVRTVHLLNPGIEFSYERAYGKKSATQLSLAYLVDLFGSSGYTDYSGYRVHLEQKLFHKQPRSYIKLYYSLETGYYNARMIDNALFRPKDSDDYMEEYSDKFNLDRSGVHIVGKYGIQFLLNRFVVDLSPGVGVMIQNVKHSNRLNPDHESVPPRHPNLDHILGNEGKRILPNLSVAAKVGFLF